MLHVGTGTPNLCLPQLLPALAPACPSILLAPASCPPRHPARPGPCHRAALTVGRLHGGHVGGSAALQEGVTDKVGEEGQAGQQGAHSCSRRAEQASALAGAAPFPQPSPHQRCWLSPAWLERYLLCASLSRSTHSEAASVLDRRQSAGRQQAGLKRGASLRLCRWDNARFAKHQGTHLLSRCSRCERDPPGD